VTRGRARSTTRVLAALCALLAATLAHSPPPGAPGPRPWVPPALRSVAVVGCDLVGGHGTDDSRRARQGNQPTPCLAEAVDASLPPGARRVWDEIRPHSFAEPLETLVDALRALACREPSRVVALDVLAASVHGPWSDAVRVERLDAVLLALEAFRCPVLLGDLPDWDVPGVGSIGLPNEVRPAIAVSARCNSRIASWARGRANVVLVPLADVYRHLAAREPFSILGHRFGADAHAWLLQSDGLHTTRAGACALWLLALEAWSVAAPDAARDRTLVRDLDVLEHAVRLGRRPGAWTIGGP
jgi:hypothetical protein